MANGNYDHNEFKAQTEQWLAKCRAPGADMVALNDELAWIVHAAGDNFIDMKISMEARNNPDISNQWRANRHVFEHGLELLVRKIKKNGIDYNGTNNASLATYLTSAFQRNIFLSGLRSLRSKGSREVSIEEAFGGNTGRGSLDLIHAVGGNRQTGLAVNNGRAGALSEPERELEMANFSRMLTMAITTLPEREKRAFLGWRIADANGKKFVDYCREKGLPYNSERMYLFKARKMIGAHLSPFEQSFER